MKGQKENKDRALGEKYPEAFKRKVIEEYLSTGVDKLSLQRKYGIRFKSAICTWMKRMGYTDKWKKMPYFEAEKQIELKEKFSGQSGPQEDIGGLKKRIKQLERQLEDEQLRSEAYKLTIEIAEKELKVSIGKKPNTK